MNYQPPYRRHAAFTLIEILVSVSIIVLLVGISLPVALKMLGGADASRARAALNALGTAATEFQQQTGGVPDHTDTIGINGLVVGDEDGNDNVDDGQDDPDNTIGLFLSRAMQIEDVNKMVRASAGKSSLVRIDPSSGNEDNTLGFDTSAAVDANALPSEDRLNTWVMRDPWDGQIRYAAKVSHTDTFDNDDYLPAHPTPFFASAGPDGLWGWVLDDGQPDPDYDDNNDGRPDAEDNLYSFEID
ncbi:MAG: type II secretion system protein [Planctomycetota bacterium]